ncbi:MAG TPA: hypothetical protein VFO83_15430 [Aggregicoccus sp.]|nr:hypothetical protein [Aggregicoccus sp.]
MKPPPSAEPRDALLESLARLPARDVSAASAARIGRRARARLVTRAQQGRFARAWDGVLEPALTTGFVLVYLGWALQVAFFLRSGG